MSICSTSSGCCWRLVGSEWPDPSASVFAGVVTNDLTWAGGGLGFWLATYTAAPATCGEAMLVPEIVLYPGTILLPRLTAFHVDLMHTPGDPTSTSVPKLLKWAKVSSGPPS